MPLTYAAAGKHTHTPKTTKNEMKPRLQREGVWLSNMLINSSWNTSQKEPFFKEVLCYSGSRSRKVKTSSWKGAKPRVVSSECQPKQVLGEIYQQSLSWREVMSYALNGDGKDRYIQAGVFLNPFNPSRCSKWPERSRHLSQEQFFCVGTGNPSG